MPDLVLLGPPGSGKGTQAKPFAAARGLTYLSTGELLRAAARAGTPAGRAASAFMDAGGLVPDELLLELLAEAMPASGFLLDVPDEELVGRLSARGREDDQPETVRRRLAVYHEQTEPVAAYYERSGRLTRVDGVGDPEEVQARLLRAADSSR